MAERGSTLTNMSLRNGTAMLSGLALAGANRFRSAPADSEDGILTAEEVSALDLSGVRWGLAATALGIAAGLAMVGWRRAQAGGAHVPETELRQPPRAA